MRPRLIIAAPGLRGPVTGCPVDQLAPPPMPGLGRLLRGTKPSRAPDRLSETLAWLFATDTGRAPEGPVALYGRGARLGSQFIYRGAPVHLRVETDHLLLFDQGLLELRTDEATALCETFNDTYREDGWELQSIAACEWYLSGPVLPQATTTPLEQVVGRNIAPYMPSGADSDQLRRLLNEVQMLFHEHPVNQRRRRNGEPLVNGIWLWGGGRLGGFDGVALKSLWSDEPYAVGLAKLTATPAHTLPENAARWQSLSLAEGDHLLLLPHAGGPALYGDVEAWHEALARLERDWFAPLASNGPPVNLLPVDGTAWENTRRLRRLFSRRRAIDAWLRQRLIP